MTTAILQKTHVEPKWTMQQTRETTSLAFMHHMTNTMLTFEKAPEAVKEFQTREIANRVAYFRKHDVKSALDLVRVMAEFEANVFGSRITIVGDDNKATMEYETCGCHEAMVREGGQMSKEQQERMFAVWEGIRSGIAREFGLKVEAKMGEKPLCVVTYSK